jgi:hypothetical protein
MARWENCIRSLFYLAVENITVIEKYPHYLEEEERRLLILYIKLMRSSLRCPWSSQERKTVILRVVLHVLLRCVTWRLSGDRPLAFEGEQEVIRAHSILWSKVLSFILGAFKALLSELSTKLSTSVQL